MSAQRHLKDISDMNKIPIFGTRLLGLTQKATPEKAKSAQPAPPHATQPFWLSSKQRNHHPDTRGARPGNRATSVKACPSLRSPLAFNECAGVCGGRRCAACAQGGDVWHLRSRAPGGVKRPAFSNAPQLSAALEQKARAQGGDVWHLRTVFPTRMETSAVSHA